MSRSSFVVSAKESGEKVLAFLHQHLPDASLNSLKKAIDNGKVRINGKTEKFHSSPVGAHDTVEIELIASKSAPIETLFEDGNFLIINKPAGLASENVKKGNLCHRLDKETSGCLLIAKTQEALKSGEALFKNKAIVKTYLAVVEGIPAKEKGIISKPLAKKGSLKGQTVWGVDENGIPALTNWKKIKSKGQISLLECEPKTGRTHQIRIHLASIGHPILGDHTYHKTQSFSKSSPRILLHAYRLQFSHPFTQDEIKIEAPIPKEIEEPFR